MACACAKNRATASGTATVSGTYRVMVGTRKVYETTNESAANTVAERFSGATILAPGETA
ncbi:hypothetical protein SEA_XKCD426_13 [Streptomyces phage Xkcd426]|nr:hypothetical protein SEA_XKCD426_13 [Streptomyces phage Xkcd426]